MRKPKPQARVVDFIAAQPLDLLYVSTVTLAEIRFRIEMVAEVNQRAKLQDWLTHMVRPMFDNRILDVSEDVMFKWRLLVEEGRKIRHSFSQPDLIIAATALCHGATIVTGDTRDYERTGVAILNPWITEASK